MGYQTENLDDIQKLLWTFATHRMITVASKTGILRRLAEANASTAILAAELGLNESAASKVVRSLVAHGFVDPDGDGYVVKASLRKYFLPGESDLSPFIDHSHDMYESFGENLEAWVRGEPWKTKTRDKESILKFALAMQAMGSGVARQLVSHIDLVGAKRMLDVGGGLGHYSKALLADYPELSATVFDIAEVAALGTKRVTGTEFEGRLAFVSGDYLEDEFGKDFDFVLLANTLHQELPADAAKMVDKAAGAVRVGGQVGVLDFAIDDRQQSHVLGSLFAINMRSFGDTYPEPTIRGWMEHAGLINVERRDLSDYRWFIVGNKSDV